MENIESHAELQQKNEPREFLPDATPVEQVSACERSIQSMVAHPRYAAWREDVEIRHWGDTLVTRMRSSVSISQEEADSLVTETVRCLNRIVLAWEERLKQRGISYDQMYRAIESSQGSSLEVGASFGLCQTRISLMHTRNNFRTNSTPNTFLRIAPGRRCDPDQIDRFLSSYFASVQVVT